MAAKDSLTAARLREVLHYEPSTGIFTWLRRPTWMFSDLRSCEAWNARYAGKVAGSTNKEGYVSIRVLDRAHWAHRLAWLYMLGEWPAFDIDHKNTNPSDNRFDNLRSGANGVNAQNKRKRPNGSSTDLPLGVHFHSRKKTRRFSSSIRVGGKPTHLGYFDTAGEAHAAHIAAKRIHHPGCTI